MSRSPASRPGFRDRLRRLARALVPPPGRPRRFVLEGLESRFLMSFDPTGMEQEMLELLNRMRLAPAAEIGLLTDNVAATPAHSANADVNSALSFFHVSGPDLAAQWSLLVPAAPLAWSPALYDSATAHNQQMIAHDDQQHQLPGEQSLGVRVQTAGYTGFSSVGENIFAFAQSPFAAHAAFAIDWGMTPTGIQTPPGHRDNMMSATFREVGLALTPESNASTTVGPLVITEDYGARFAQGNPFVLGVVYKDLDGDGAYDAGEGLAGVSVHVDGVSDFDTTTMTAGGWQLQAPAGTYSVTFSGGTLATPSTVSNVTVAGANTKVDLRASRFTDEPLVVASTPVSAVHIQELRDTINTLRTGSGLTAFTFTDPVLTPGVTPVRAVHIEELRQAVNEVFTHAAATVPTYTDPVIVPGETVVKAAHIEELRTAARGPQGTPSAVTLAAEILESLASPVTAAPPEAHVDEPSAAAPVVTEAPAATHAPTTRDDPGSDRDDATADGGETLLARMRRQVAAEDAARARAAKDLVLVLDQAAAWADATALPSVPVLESPVTPA